MDMETVTSLQESMIDLLKKDSNKILALIGTQSNHLMKEQYPFYEELLDTQMFGFSRVIDFLVRLGLLSETEGKIILLDLETRIIQTVETLDDSSNQK
ncbi:DUF1507 family protein [Ammoniphilus sp. 3BR4]|uniref:DUF1507 family protein n=1 Tax=Ammoniphilus sp. 3BR4 TaxID=3158265 RepID=UPI00346657A6